MFITARIVPWQRDSKVEDQHGNVEQDWKVSREVLHLLISLSVLLRLSFEKHIFSNEGKDPSFGSQSSGSQTFL